MSLKDIVKETKAYLCLECGVCFGSCPISRINPAYSPRLAVKKALFNYGDEIMDDRDLWSCLACGTCTARCPSDVDYQRFIREARKEAARIPRKGLYAHNEVLQTIMRLHLLDLPQDRTRWIGDDLRVAETGEYLYFTGCLPYFDLVFRDWSFTPTGIGRSTIKVLNALGIEPIVSNREKCCGHDLLWNGDEESFKRLAEANIRMIEESGARKVVLSCPEGYFSLKNEYPEYFGELPFEVIHFTELLAGEIEAGKVKFKENGQERKVAFQDPCNLGRLSGIYEDPRQVLAAIPGVELRELKHNRADAICCGTSNWINCSTCSKQLQIGRMEEALEAGATTLVTACPKCQIHFRCALDKSELEIEIADLETLAAEAIEA
jgi:Fe-S oxidoreductase